MSHDFSALSPLDFENLCADVVGAELSVRFELFAPGPDSGIDFRCQDGGVEVIGQAKHYARWQDLKRAIVRERAKVERLSPGRYILCTSCALTPGNKDELLALLTPYCRDTGDIWGREDIDAALGRYPQVLRRHVKLWLRDEIQLHAVLHNGLLQMSAARQAELQREMAHFVVHPLIDRLHQHLQHQSVLLISGAAGVGKTATCAYLALQLAAADDYEFYFLNDVSSIKHVWKLQQAGRKQCFVMDDFLGATFLDPQNVLSIEQELVTLLDKAQRPGGTLKLLLATRDYVLSQAAERLPKLHAWLGSKRQQMSVSIEYLKAPIQSKANILYNLMFYSDLSPDRRDVLVQRKSYKEIIEHRHFNPRLLKNIFNDPEANHVEHVHTWLLQRLNDPAEYWGSTFLRLSKAAQSLLYTLALGPSPVVEADLMRGFGALYRNMYGRLPLPNALQASVAELEPGLAVSFTHRESVWLRFANPGVVDMVHGMMAKHAGLESALVSSVQFYEQGEQLYRLSLKKNSGVVLTPAQLIELLCAMERCADVETQRLWGPYGNGMGVARGFGEADHLNRLWAVLEACRDNLPTDDLQPLIEKLTTRARRADWDAWCAQQAYGALTDMALALLAGDDLRRAVAAMIVNIGNSEDALYMARIRGEAPVASILTDHDSAELINHIMAACEEEIERADDEDHLHAIVSDIEEIEGLISGDMDDVKYGAIQKLEDFGRAAEYEEYDGPPLASFRERNTERRQAWAYVDALFTRA